MSVPMKDSGVEWLGQVPEHWDVVPPIALFTESKERVNAGDQLLSATQKYGVIPLAEFEKLEQRQVTKANANLEMRKHVEVGDFVISMRSMDGGLERSRAVGSVRSSYTVLKAGPRVEGRYFGMLLKCSLYIQALRLTSNFIRDGQDLSFAHVRQVILPLPSLEEQAAIADHLDRATTRIDALVAKKTRFIELLREKRQAAIAHAVTKGLDSEVPMKDSGIEWLGEVPAHWDVSKLAYVAKEQGGKTPTTTVDAYWNGDIPWVTPKDMKTSEISGAIDTISEEAVRGFGMSLLNPGAVLVVVRGMILAHSFPVAELKVHATINQDMKALLPSERILPTYLLLLLQSYRPFVVSMAVAEAAHGTRVLRTEVWRLLPALLPPICEQRHIIAHLSGVTTRIDTLIAKTERSIELLREHRKALITAAVTGKIDLREGA